MSRIFQSVIGMLVACMLVTSACATKPSNKWRLEFSGGSHSAGEIVVELKPIGGNPMIVHIPVPADKSENAVAKHVVKVLRAKLPEEAYHVERDDGEDVLIKKRHGAANFDLQVLFNSVKHVRVRVDRE
jgi:hypothetical protein